MPQVKYTPLKASHGEIRLIKLLPGSFHDDIEIELVHAQLLDNVEPEYEALSYVWGSEKDLVPITIHQLTFNRHLEILAHHLDPTDRQPKRLKKASRVITGTLSITKNLSIALKHLRHRYDYRVMWVDAICINQSNVEERSAQIGRISSIYGHARRVVVWLGPEDKESKMALDTLRWMGEQTRYYPNTNTCALQANSKMDILTVVPATAVNFRLEWKAINGLLHRDWFTRLWVHQEIRLSKDAIMVVGYTQLPWSYFYAAIHWINLYAISSSILLSIFDHTYMVKFIMPLLIPGQSDSISDALIVTRAAICKDPKDRAYAIMSLVNATSNVVADYTKSKEEIYQNFVEESIRSIRRLDILSLCELSVLTSTLPSWVPDLWNHFDACKRSSYEGSFDPDDNSLHIHTVCSGSIMHTQTPISSTATLSEIIATYKKWQPPNLLTSFYIDRTCLLDVFLTTILYGQIQENYSPVLGLLPTMSQCRHAFFSLLHGSNLDTTNTYFARAIMRSLRGRTLCTTQEGRIAICPANTQVTDEIHIALGGRSPLVLRPTDQPKHYRVVGECYLYGSMDGEALLGPLPPPWKRGEMGRTGDTTYLYNNEMVTLADPRLGPLPKGWNIAYEGGVSMDEDGHFSAFQFVHEDRPEVSQWFDPRMTRAVLMEKGVELEEVVLV